MLIDIYLETGAKKTFAVALDWPGWARPGRDEASALHALLDYSLRYARAAGKLGFAAPAGPDDLRIVERLPGTATTDFGAPDVMSAADRLPLDDAGFKHLVNGLGACFDEYERVYQSAIGVELARGPRGGGRDLRGVTLHVLNSAASYLSKIGGKVKIDEAAPDLLVEFRRATTDMLAACNHAQQHGVPESGPRGGSTWPLPYFIRRLSWHILDHAWEIEDRKVSHGNSHP